MIFVAYGGGTNSTAMIIEMVKKDIPIDLILFADTGGEKPYTYEYIDLFSRWLVKNNQPAITTVSSVDKNQLPLTLEDHCFKYKCLPSIAYGFKSCSVKFKISPQNKYCNNWLPAKEKWSQGTKIKKFIGFDADEAHRVKDFNDKKYDYVYPLIDWGMGRDECLEVIDNTGLPRPGKSACFFCPSSKPYEVRALMLVHPHLAQRALAIEDQAELTSIRGLGRSFSWKNLLATSDMFDDQIYHNVDISCGCYDG